MIKRSEYKTILCFLLVSIFLLQTSVEANAHPCPWQDAIYKSYYGDSLTFVFSSNSPYRTLEISRKNDQKKYSFLIDQGSSERFFLYDTYKKENSSSEMLIINDKYRAYTEIPEKNSSSQESVIILDMNSLLISNHPTYHPDTQTFIFHKCLK